MEVTYRVQIKIVFNGTWMNNYDSECSDLDVTKERLQALKHNCDYLDAEYRIVRVTIEPVDLNNASFAVIEEIENE